MENNNLQPINTHYKGYYFRSRLEARYAVMFDALGWEWEYEPEGFQLKSGWYLPDFYFPGLGMYAEVKARELNEQELETCLELSKGKYSKEYTGQDYSFQVLLLEGQPECKPYRILEGGVIMQTAYLFSRNDKYFPTYPKNSDPYQSLYLFMDAVNRAKAARFEHGEQFIQAPLPQPKQEFKPDYQRELPKAQKTIGKFSLAELKKKLI